MGSRSAGVLTEELRARGHRVLKVFPNRLYSPRDSDLIINWGNSNPPMTWDYLDDQIINMCGPVRRASNKLDAFGIIQGAGVSIPEFTTDVNIAQTWYEVGVGIVGRRLLQGHSGNGIETWGIHSEDNPIDAPHCPLYVKYIKKSAEYRVHVFNGQVIDVQQKRRRNGLTNDEVNFQIRVHDNGWVFTREDINTPEMVTRESIKAVNALGLDFGAVDVIYNRHYSTAYVLEVNCAPGIENTTVQIYANAIESLI
jgi:hypothetical protein